MRRRTAPRSASRKPKTISSYSSCNWRLDDGPSLDSSHGREEQRSGREDTEGEAGVDAVLEQDLGAKLQLDGRLKGGEIARRGDVWIAARPDGQCDLGVVHRQAAKGAGGKAVRQKNRVGVRGHRCVDLHVA